MNYVGRLVIVALIVEASSLDLPSSFRSCDQHSPAFLTCVSNAATDAVISMASGLEGYKTLPLDPLEAGDVTIGSRGGAVSVMQSYKNVKLYGLTKKFRMDFDQIDLQKLIFRSKCFNDRVDFVADYAMDGRILLLPIKGRGRSNITMVGLKSDNVMYAEKYQKNGETYLKVKKYDCKFTPTKVVLEFTNLFSGDPVLSVQMNKFLNENSKLMFQETKDEYEETFSLIFTKLANDIFNKVPMNKIFPE